MVQTVMSRFEEKGRGRGKEKEQEKEKEKEGYEGREEQVNGAKEGERRRWAGTDD